MRRRITPLFNGLFWAILMGGMPLAAAIAASGNCAALGPLPATLAIGEGQQQELQSPVPITRLAGKWKVSQNRPAADRAGVAAGLLRAGGESHAAMATAVRPPAA